MPRPSVPLESRRRLFNAAAVFAAAKPWQYMGDADAFAVRDAATGVLGCCCIIGSLGEVFGLTAYRGLEGFELYERIQAREADPAAVAFTQDVLLAEFVPKRELEAVDKSWLVGLGLANRTPAGYPKFRSFRPGLAPWPIDAAEADFLTRTFRCALHFATGAGRTESSVEPKSRRRLYPFYDWSAGDFETIPIPRLLCPEPPAEAPPLPGPVFDAASLGPAAKRRTPGIWEVAISHYPSVIEEGDRPFYMRIALVVEAASGMVLHFHLAKPAEEPAQVALDAILGASDKVGALPASIRLEDERLKEALGPAFKALSVRSCPIGELRALADAREVLLGAMTEDRPGRS
jgi:Domain of unknown function (DUF6930)